MNPSRTLILAFVALFAVALEAKAQTSVSTDPVGFVCTELPATGYTYFGANLTNAPLLTSSNTSLDGDEVTVGIDLTSLDSNKDYTMDIADGTYEGYSVEIASWSGQVLTFPEDLEGAGVDPVDFDGSRVVVREIPTIASIFGETNSAGLKAGSFANADLIYLYGATGFTKYYYFPGGFGQIAGWRDENGTYSGTAKIRFGDGIVIQTRDTATKKVVISGSVKKGPTNIPVLEGFNLLANPSPIDGRLMLSNSGLQDGLQGGTAANADIVYIPSSTGGFDRYFYFPGGFGQTAEWRNADTGANADSTPLPDSGSFFVDRRSGGSSVMITEDLPND